MAGLIPSIIHVAGGRGVGGGVHGSTAGDLWSFEPRYSTELWVWQGGPRRGGVSETEPVSLGDRPDMEVRRMGFQEVPGAG